jgi:hypothetical protein
MTKDIKAVSRQGHKFCVSCMRWMSEVGGKNITSDDKLTYKWKCGKCLEDKNG